MLSNVSNFSVHILLYVLLWKKNSLGKRKGFVLYFNWKKTNPRIMFTFMFSVVQSHGHTTQTSAFSQCCCVGHWRSGHYPLNLSLRHKIAEEISSYWRRWDFLESRVRSCVNFSWLSYVVYVVQSGNGKCINFWTLPNVLCSNGLNNVSSILDAALVCLILLNRDDSTFP